MTELQTKALSNPFARADKHLPPEYTEWVDGNWLVGLSVNK
jgi:hypothetical protein